MSFMNQLATLARKPAQSCFTPMLRTKPPKPERSARSLKRTARRRRAASFAIRPATIQPTTRITAKAITFGMAPKNMARPPASAVSIASDQSCTAVNMAISGKVEATESQQAPFRRLCGTCVAGCGALQRGGGKGVAVLGPSGVEAALEPPHPLRGSAVGERFRHDAALRLLLQAIVADGRGGVERLFQVARLQLLHRAGVVAPDPGIAIGLKLHANRDAVVFSLRGASLRVFQPLEAAGELLHVVADFVRDHVRLREIARRMEAVLEIAVERKVDVQLLVVRAVERPHRRLAGAAGRARHAVVEYQRRRPVLPARLLEDARPDVLAAAEHAGDELTHLVRRRAARRLARLAWRAHLLRDVERGAGVEAEEVRDDGDDDAADAEATANHADAATVLDVAAGALVTEIHSRSRAARHVPRADCLLSHLTRRTGTSDRRSTLFAVLPSQLADVPMQTRSKPPFFACSAINSAGSPTRMRVSNVAPARSSSFFAGASVSSPSSR